jgi:hypothetical protein
VLQHRQLDTEAKRMGAIVRAHHEGLSLWRSHDREDRRVNWTG